MPAPFDKTINQLDAVLLVNDEDKLVLTQAGVTMRCNAGQLRADVSGNGDLTPTTDSFDVPCPSQAIIGDGATWVPAEGLKSFSLAEDTPVQFYATFEIERECGVVGGDNVDGVAVSCYLRLHDGFAFTTHLLGGVILPYIVGTAFPINNNFFGGTVSFTRVIDLPAGTYTGNIIAGTGAVVARFRVNGFFATSRWGAIIPLQVAQVSTERITEDGQLRETEAGDVRIVNGSYE